MIDSQVQTELLQAMEHLPLAQQQCVVEFAKEINSNSAVEPKATRPEIPASVQDEMDAPKIMAYFMSRLRASSPAEEPIRGTPFEKIQHLLGTLPDDIADDMLRAIEEHCERIDPNEW